MQRPALVSSVDADGSRRDLPRRLLVQVPGVRSTLLGLGADSHAWASAEDRTGRAELLRSCRGEVVTRRRPLVHLSLSPDALARLAEIATRCGETRSGVVERLIRDAEMPRPRTAGKVER